MKKIIILGGPTASGKSKFALNLAKLVEGEIINADSMQVYKYFSILTSQPKKNDYKVIPHHLYGYVETNIKYNAVKWLNDTNTKIEKIRIIKGTNFDYFSDQSKKILFEKEFTVSKLTDRMGMRLEGPKIENIINTNIKSEGLIKGVIQIPADGNPIIMLSDHGTIGGYPKIASVISADYDKLVQLPPGSKIKFQSVKLKDAETLFKLYEMETQNLISQIK